MAYGLVIKDAAGNVMLDLSRRLGRIIGSLDTGISTSGSVVVPEFATNEPFWFTLPKGSIGNWYDPGVLISGTTLSWAFGATAVPNDLRLFYGVY